MRESKTGCQPVSSTIDFAQRISQQAGSLFYYLVSTGWQPVVLFGQQAGSLLYYLVNRLAACCTIWFQRSRN